MTKADRTRSDAQLDALVRRAADRPTDEAALARRVLARVAAARDAPGLTGWLFDLPVPRLVPAGFAAVLAVTPFALAAIPASGDPVAAAVLGLATGAPGAILPGADALAWLSGGYE